MQQRVALVHDWLVTYRGGEKVLLELARMYPDAPIFTLFFKPDALPSELRDRNIIYPKGLQRFAFARKALLPLLPTFVEQLDLQGFDLVISTSSCVAKGVIPQPEARHLCYIHSPMRYAWDQRQHYLRSIPRIPGARGLWNYLMSRMRVWDVSSSARVDCFVANSTFVQSRVQRYYRRNSVVVHPPVEVERFTASRTSSDGYFLAAGALVPYKRFDLAIAACEASGKRLVIAGDGPELHKLKRLAGRHTTFIQRPDDSQWANLMSKADALLFPGIEDFGIVPIEALAAGTPVIAMKAGGAIDYVLPGQTGLFFEEQTVTSLQHCLENFDASTFSVDALREFAMKFTQRAFQDRMKSVIEELTSGK